MTEQADGKLRIVLSLSLSLTTASFLAVALFSFLVLKEGFTLRYNSHTVKLIVFSVQFRVMTNTVV